MDNILEIKNLNVAFDASTGQIQAVRGVSFNVGRGECLGIVGESGSGKSVTSLSILKLLADSGRITDGEILFDGENLVKAGWKRIRDIRGGKISMIFQDPMTSLNPLIPMGEQVEEMLWSHNRDLPKSEIKRRGLELFRLVRIPEPEKRYVSFPHEFSGGMRQRVMIAMALACHPDLLIADEPTTALDVTIQDQILKLLRSLQDEFGMSIMFITHDLGVVAEICTRVIVMYGGLIMEEAPIDEIFDDPKHPYTVGLLSSIPNIGEEKARRLNPIPGSPPDMSNPPAGCPFAPRCPHARVLCAESLPPYTMTGPEHRSLCWLLSPEAPAEENPFAEKERTNGK